MLRKIDLVPHNIHWMLIWAGEEGPGSWQWTFRKYAQIAVVYLTESFTERLQTSKLHKGTSMILFSFAGVHICVMIG